MEENKEIYIDLSKIFSTLKKKIVFILLIAFIGAAISGCITNFFITPKYTAYVQLHVYSSSDNRIGTSSSITSNEYDAAQKLVNTYLVVVKSNTFREKVADKLGNSITAGQLKHMISCAAIEDTVAFQINVTSTSPQQAMDIANAVAETCPDEIVRILKVGGVEVIDYATLPTSPSSPDMKKNLLIGFVAAFFVAFIVFYIKELFDTSIHDQRDLESEFDIPILGTIPRLIPITDKKESGSTISTATLEPPKPSIDTKLNDKEEKE